MIALAHADDWFPDDDGWFQATAAPTLLAALEKALGIMEKALAVMLLSHCVDHENGPVRSTLDPDVEDDVTHLEAAINDARAAIALATGAA